MLTGQTGAFHIPKVEVLKLIKKLRFASKLRWMFSDNPKHELNKKLEQLNTKKNELKQFENQLKTNVDKLHQETIRLAQLQKHIHTNHENTLKELEELKAFKSEKSDVEHVIKSIHHLIGHVPDHVADEFVNSKDFSRFQKVMCKHFKDYEPQ